MLFRICFVSLLLISSVHPGFKFTSMETNTESISSHNHPSEAVRDMSDEVAKRCKQLGLTDEAPTFSSTEELMEFTHHLSFLDQSAFTERINQLFIPQIASFILKTQQWSGTSDTTRGSPSMGSTLFVFCNRNAVLWRK